MTGLRGSGQYVLFAPPTVDPSDLPEARQVYLEIERIRVEGKAQRQKIAEDAVAQIADILGRYQADMAAQQEDLERTKRASSSIASWSVCVLSLVTLSSLVDTWKKGGLIALPVSL